MKGLGIMSGQLKSDSLLAGIVTMLHGNVRFLGPRLRPGPGTSYLFTRSHCYYVTSQILCQDNSTRV